MASHFTLMWLPLSTQCVSCGYICPHTFTRILSIGPRSHGQSVRDFFLTTFPIASLNLGAIGRQCDGGNTPFVTSGTAPRTGRPICNDVITFVRIIRILRLPLSAYVYRESYRSGRDLYHGDLSHGHSARDLSTVNRSALSFQGQKFPHSHDEGPISKELGPWGVQEQKFPIAKTRDQSAKGWVHG